MIHFAFNPQTVRCRHLKNIIVRFSDFIDFLAIPCFLVFFIIICINFFPIISMAAENSIYLTSQRLEYYVPSKKVFVQGDVTMTEEGLRLTTEKM